MFQKLVQLFLQKFVKNMGRGPQNRAEWMQIQDDAVRYLNKTKGAPSIKKEPFQGWNPKVIEGGKSKKGIEGLMKKGDLTRGTAPKTTPETLKTKKDRHILLRDADEDILRIKRENKEAIDRFKRKMNPDEPDKFYAGGIAPLVGEPTRTPYEFGGTYEDFEEFMKDREKRYREGDKYQLLDEWKKYKRQRKYGRGAAQDAAQGGRIGMAGGGALFKFIEKLFIKASNDIRRGQGKWKGLDWKQKMKLSDFDVTGKKGHAEGGRIGMAGGTSSPRFNHPDKRQGILGSGVTWTELMEDLHPFMYSPGMIERTKRDIIDPIFKKKLKWNELDEYYRQLEMDKDMRDPEDIPSKGEQYAATGGIARVGMFVGGGLKLKKFLLNKKTIRKAVDDIFPTGDYKYDAEMAAQALVENNPKFFKNKLIDDLSDADRSDIYGAVLPEVQSDFAKTLQLKRASRPTKTLKGIEETGTIDISDPNIAEEFTKFMKETDPKGYAKIQKVVDDANQQLELKRFKTKDRKPNASGGLAGMLGE